MEAGVVWGETCEFVARQLGALHRPRAGRAPVNQAPVAAPADPTRGRLARVEPTFSASASVPAPAPAPTGPACKECAARAGAILHGKFGYYFKCDACGKNTAIRFTCQPGHQPRLRKDGRSEEPTSELQSLMRHSYAIFCLKKK